MPRPPLGYRLQVQAHPAPLPRSQRLHRVLYQDLNRRTVRFDVSLASAASSNLTAESRSRRGKRNYVIVPMYIATGTQDGDSPMTMFENWPYALIGISCFRKILAQPRDGGILALVKENLLNRGKTTHH